MGRLKRGHAPHASPFHCHLLLRHPFAAAHSGHVGPVEVRRCPSEDLDLLELARIGIQEEELARKKKAIKGRLKK
jgi:hypothetical protein